MQNGAVESTDVVVEETSGLKRLKTGEMTEMPAAKDQSAAEHP